MIILVSSIKASAAAPHRRTQEESTGYLEPIDWQHSILSIPPTTAAGNDDG